MTKKGEQCIAFAVHGTDPPMCPVHQGMNVGAGGQRGNQNARKHGFYSRYYTADELNDLAEEEIDLTLDGEIKVVRVALRRALRVLDDDESDPVLVAALVPLVFSGSRTIARLLRDRRQMNGESGETVMKEMADALDDLAAEWGISL